MRLLTGQSKRPLSKLLVYIMLRVASCNSRLTQVAVRLLEFATVRAMEIQAAAAKGKTSASNSGEAYTAAARAVLAGESRQPCKLRMRVAQAKAELIRQRESELLLPAAGPGATEILRLLRPQIKTGAPATTDVTSSAALAIGQATVGGTALSAGSFVPVTGPDSSEAANAAATSSELVGMSCTIGSSGEVCSCVVPKRKTPMAS